MTVNERIFHARTAKGLSQRQVAERIASSDYTPDYKRTKISAAYLSRIEAGERFPSVQAIRMIAWAMDVDAHWLETGELLVTQFVGSDFGLTDAEQAELAVTDRYAARKMADAFLDGTAWGDVAPAVAEMLSRILASTTRRRSPSTRRSSCA